jgi:predicted lipid-binding transport protein (Tim44 family)
LHAAYAEVFKYIDPAEDDVERVRDAFRHFTPIGMQERMVSLFLGLCALAGIIEEAPKRRGRPPKIEGQVPKAVKPKREPSKPQQDIQGPPPAPASAGLHPFIVGLLDALPPVGTTWPEPKREAWIAAAKAAFNMIYEVDDAKSSKD